MPHCQSILRSLRKNGYRITPQREMIIETLAHHSGHLSAEDIFAALKTRTQAINLATVYRTLDMLVGAGFASRVSLGEGCVVYATSQHGPHIHLVCRACGVITTGDPHLLETISQRLLSDYRFSADVQHVTLSGLCSGCQERSKHQLK